MSKTRYESYSKQQRFCDVSAKVLDVSIGKIEIGNMFIKYTEEVSNVKDGNRTDERVIKGIITESVKQYVKEYPNHIYHINSGAGVIMHYAKFERFVKVDGKDGIVFFTSKDYVKKAKEQLMNTKKEDKVLVYNKVCDCNWQKEKGKMTPEIIISSDGEKVVEAKRVVEVNGEWEVVGKGVSRCHPLDKFSLKEGTKQALKRLFGVMEKEKEHTLEMSYKGKSYGKVGLQTSYSDIFKHTILDTGDQVQVLYYDGAAKGVITKDCIITNDKILPIHTQAFISLIKKYDKVKSGDVFAGVVYE